MDLPSNTDRLFFAYGLLRPGQSVFFQLRGLVSEVTGPANVTGKLPMRDGLPIIDPAGHENVKGTLLTFLPERTAEAHGRIKAQC